MGMVAIFVMWPGPFEQNFVPLILRRLHMKIGFNRLRGDLGTEV